MFMNLTPKSLDILVVIFGSITILWISTFLVHMHTDTVGIKQTQSLIISNQQSIMSNQGVIISGHTNR